MALISVLGLGNWGTALAHHLGGCGHSVVGWDKESSIVNSVNTSRVNPCCAFKVPLSHNIKATTDIKDALGCQIIVMAFASTGLKEMIPKIQVASDSIVVSAIKGFETETLLTPLQYSLQHLPVKANLVTISGPSFASDVVHQKPCGIVAASSNEEAAKQTAEVFSSGPFRVYVSTDPLGVELGGVLKNVIALAAGVSDGLELGDSARTALITRGLAEITRLAVAMGAKEKTLFGLSGMGDLVMTASSTLSRNRTVGYRLGKGETLNQILSSLGSTAEGVKTAPLVLKLAKKFKVEMPISEGTYSIINGDRSPQEVLTAFLNRPVKRED